MAWMAGKEVSGRTLFKQVWPKLQKALFQAERF
jgi:hypothetical protein